MPSLPHSSHLGNKADAKQTVPLAAYEMELEGCWYLEPTSTQEYYRYPLPGLRRGVEDTLSEVGGGVCVPKGVTIHVFILSPNIY